jgi:hypothetical protein
MIGEEDVLDEKEEVVPAAIEDVFEAEVDDEPEVEVEAFDEFGADKALDE